MVEVLNVKTGHAQGYYPSKEEEPKAKIAKDTYKIAHVRELVRRLFRILEHPWSTSVCDCKIV